VDGPVGIVAGAPADFLSLSGQATALAFREKDALLDTLIFAGGKDCIDSVWSAGRKVVSQGRHHARDAVAARYVEVLRRLLV
jgi:cytosine/adenosine deaminase-related metal-dependent hydrolase